MIKALLRWLFNDDKVTDDDLAKAYKEIFPNQCVVCSYHAHEYANGITDDPIPPKHNCIYVKSTPKQ